MKITARNCPKTEGTPDETIFQNIDVTKVRVLQYGEMKRKMVLYSKSCPEFEQA